MLDQVGTVCHVLPGHGSFRGLPIWVSGNLAPGRLAPLFSERGQLSVECRNDGRFRRCGVGRKLATVLLEQRGQAGRLITVNAAAGSILFWEALGFKPDLREGHTHVLNPKGR